MTLKPGTWVRYHGRGPYPAKELIGSMGIIIDNTQHINWVFCVDNKSRGTGTWEPANYEVIVEPNDELDKASR